MKMSALHARCGPCELFWHRVLWLFLCADTLPIRALLGVTSLLWALALFLPGDTLVRPVYHYMRIVAGDAWWSEHVWATAWALHGALLLYRTFADAKGKTFALLLNVFGLMLYFGALVAMFMTRTYPFPAALATDLSLAFAAFWLLIRTSVNSEPGWRSD